MIQAPILHYSYPSKYYIVYTDTSDDTCRSQLSQKHDRWELQVTFLSHTFNKTQQKWSTPEQEAYWVYFTITKWNLNLHDSGIVVKNAHKPLQKFLNGKSANNNANHWSVELANYNVTFEWISGACIKAADCLSRLVEVPQSNAAASSILINVVIVSPTDGSTPHTHSKTNIPVVTTAPGNSKVTVSPPSMGITRILYCRCNGQILSASTSLGHWTTERHPTMNPTHSHTLMM